MKKIQLGILLLLLSVVSKAQLTGVKTIPGDYATLAAAITDLNTQGVGAGGVTINLTQAETAPAGGYLIGSLTLNASTNVSNPVVINGGNNVITAFTGTSANVDVVVKVAGADYVTLNQLNIQENASNTTATAQMERGIWGCIFSQNDACQNLTIQNCTVNLSGTAASVQEVGILINGDIYTSTSSFSTVFATLPTNVSGYLSNITVKSNTINNCFTGIYVRGNLQAGSASVTAVMMATNITIGGPTLADGNTISNFGQLSGGTAYGIFTLNINDQLVQNNTISTNLNAGLSTAQASIQGINSGVSTGSKVISNNDISLQSLVAASTNAVSAIILGTSNLVGYPMNTNVIINNNNIHDFSIVGTGTVILMQPTANSTGVCNVQYNTFNNITRSGANGATYGVLAAFNGSGTRSISYNTFNNIAYTATSGTTSVLCHLINTGNTSTLATTTGNNPSLSSQSGEVKGNVFGTVNIAGTGTGTHSIYAIVNAFTFGNLNIDSNMINGFTIATANANFAGIYCNNLLTATTTISRNSVSNINKSVLSTAGGLTIDGIAILGTAGSRTLINNMISNIVCSACHLDNSLKGINITGAVNTNQIYNNTIYLGSAGTLTSSATNFGVSGISFSLGSIVDFRNNIVNVNATPAGTGIVAAIRSADAGTAGTVPSGYGSTCNNNVYYAPNAANSYFYAEGLASGTIVNGYSLTNDPIVNTGCSAFKAFASGRESASFVENNLSAVTATTFAPSGTSFAESGGQTLALVTNDYNSVVRSIPPDMGALEFAGTVTDAAPPTISYSAPYYSFLCVGLPSISVNITDVSGVNNTAGTKPRLYYKKTTDNDAYAGNTSADNGWKYVEASNSSSPFSFTFDGSILQTPAVVNDVLQYFVVAQDNATIPNLAVSSAAFAAGYCPSSVALTAAAFPTQNTVAINTILLANYGLTTLVPSANPANACLGGSTVLTLSDTILAPGNMPTGYYNAPSQITGTTNEDIRRVQIVGTSLNNSSTCATTGGGTANGLPGSILNRYSNYTATVAPVTLTNGTNYSFSLDISNCTATTSTGTAVFIDLNRNGSFEFPGERIYGSTTTSSVNNSTVTTITFSYTIPAGTTSGPTLMRVVTIQNVAGNTITNTSTSANGEVEDYQIYLNSTQVKLVNSLANNSFVWTPSTDIATNPNRTVNANNITSTTTYTVTSTDPGGCTASATITVNMATPVVATGITGNISYCNYAGANTTLTVTTANGSTPITATWTGGPIQSTSGLSATVNPPQGITTYTVTVTDACGTSATTTVDVEVKQVPSVTFTPGSGPACSGTTSNQTAVGVGTNPTYLWMPGSLTGANQSLAPTIATTYTVTITSNGCSSTNTFTLTPSTTPTITSITPNPTLACVGDSVQITTVATAGVSYSWSPTTGLSNPSVQNPKAAPSAPTIYTVTVTTAAGCTKTNNVLVNVHPLITGTKGITPSLICAGQTTTVTATVPSQCGGTTAGFQQGYAPANWTLSQTNSNGTVVTTGAPANIQLKSGTIGNGNPGSTNYAITVGCSGTISFNWSYSTPDFAYNDYPKYKLNGNAAVIFPTFDINGGSTQSGTFSLAVSPGDVFMLQMYTEDNDPFQATTTFTNFSGPAAPVSGTASIWTAKTGGTNLGTPPQTFTPSATTKYYIQYTQSGTGCVNPFRDSVEVTVNPLPTVTVTPNPGAAVCLGNPVTLQGSGASTYTWNGVASSGSDTTIAPAVAATYTVVGTDGNGCTNSATQQITINALPTVAASASPNDTVCIGSNVTLQGSGAATYTWNGIATSGSDTLLAPATAGSYTVVGTDANGCSNSATQEVWVNNPIVTATANPSTAICSGSPVTLQGAGALTYTWDGNAVTGSDTTLNPAVAGTYTVVGTDIIGCTSSATIAITINALPSVTASVSNATPCDNSSVIFTGGGATTYSWTNGITDGTPYIPTAATYTVTGTDGNGCSATASVSVSPNAANADLSNATAGNTSSLTGNSTGTDNYVPGGNQNFYTGSCNLIAGVYALGSLGSITADVTVDGLSPYPTHNGQPYVRRWFQLTPTTNGPATVTFYLTQDDFDQYNTYATANGWPLLPTGPSDAAGIANLVVTKNDNTGLGNNPIVIVPTSVNWNAVSYYWEVTLNTPSFSQFHFHAVNPVNAALSVQLANFNGDKLDQQDVLTWTTSSETNNAYFNLQYSVDGKNYTTLSRVNSKANQGNSSVTLSYSAVNTQPKAGHNYYRLQQVDLDGKSSIHSKVIDLIRNNNENVVSIYPNPVQQILNVEIYTPKAQQVMVRVMDMSGRIVKQVQAISTEGNNVISLTMNDAAQGLYTLETLINGKSVQINKFTKE
ncbi:MAG: T9SS type A sorting domain-containing protein [Chitinophagaceae bacterium]|nr:T9SS type A sorting domain-containing protein [Chitinophagaceae bacterium]